MVSEETDAEKTKFKEAIKAIREKYGFTENGIVVIEKGIVLDFSFEEIRDLAKKYE